MALKRDELLEAAAQALLDGKMLDGHFLAEHNVSRADAYALYHKIGLILLGFECAPGGLQETQLAAGAITQLRGKEVGTHAWYIGIQEWSMKRASAELDQRLTELKEKGKRR